MVVWWRVKQLYSNVPSLLPNKPLRSGLHDRIHWNMKLRFKGYFIFWQRLVTLQGQKIIHCTLNYTPTWWAWSRPSLPIIVTSPSVIPVAKECNNWLPSCALIEDDFRLASMLLPDVTAVLPNTSKWHLASPHTLVQHLRQVLEHSYVCKILYILRVFTHFNVHIYVLIHIKVIHKCLHMPNHTKARHVVLFTTTLRFCHNSWNIIHCTSNALN